MGLALAIKRHQRDLDGSRHPRSKRASLPISQRTASIGDDTSRRVCVPGTDQEQEGTEPWAIVLKTWSDCATSGFDAYRVCASTMSGGHASSSMMWASVWSSPI